MRDSVFIDKIVAETATGNSNIRFGGFGEPGEIMLTMLQDEARYRTKKTMNGESDASEAA